MFRWMIEHVVVDRGNDMIHTYDRKPVLQFRVDKKWVTVPTEIETKYVDLYGQEKEATW